MKPRYKLRTDGTCVLLPRGHVSISIDAVRRVRAASAAPLPVSECAAPTKVDVRSGDDPAARVRRQVLRAYGTLGNFCRSSGIRPHALRVLFKTWLCYPWDHEVTQWRAALGMQS